MNKVWNNRRGTRNVPLVGSGKTLGHDVVLKAILKGNLVD